MCVEIRHRIKLLYLLIFLSCSHLSGQGKIDSLLRLLSAAAGAERFEKLISLSNEYLYIDAEKSIYYSREGLKIAYELKDEKKEAIARSNIGQGEYRAGDYTKALEYLYSANEQYKKLKEEKGVARTSGFIALVYSEMERYDMALDVMNQLLLFYSQNNMPGDYSKVLLNISNILMAKNDFDKALDGYFKSLEIQKKVDPNNKDIFGIIYCNIGEAYFGKKQYDLSYKYRKMSLALYKELNFTDGIANLQMDIGSSLIKLKDYGQAEQYLNNALKNYKAIKFSEGIRKTEYNFVTLYKETNQFDAALEKCAGLEKLSADAKDSTMLTLCYYAYAEIYSAVSNYKTSAEYYKKYIDLKEKLDSKENKQKLMELQTVFETEEKEFENKTLRQENELQKEKLEAKETVLIAVFAGIILAGILLFALFLKEKKIRKINDAIKSQNLQLEEHIITKDKFFSILAHNLKNPFWAILGQNKLLKDEYDNLSEDERKELISYIGVSADNVYKLFEDLLRWAKTQRNTIKIEKDPLLLNELLNTSIKPYEIIARNKKINLELGCNGQVEIQADRFMLETVIGNLVDNAIKYSNPKEKIIISTREMEDKIEISIKDFGAGMTQDKITKLFKLGEDISSAGTLNEKGTGLGLIICKEFVEKHNGDIVVDSCEGGGTAFTVILPKN
jgi:signal transduction histidine kinase